MLKITITTATNEIITTKEVKSISAMWTVLRAVRDTNEAPNGLVSTTTDEAGQVVNKVQFVLTKAGKIQFKDITEGKTVIPTKPSKEAAPKVPKKAMAKAAKVAIPNGPLGSSSETPSIIGRPENRNSPAEKN